MENRGRLAAFRDGESGARRRHGALVTPEGWPLPLDGDERPREFNRMEFSVMCNGCNGYREEDGPPQIFWGRVIIRGRSRPPSTTHGEASGGFNPNGACYSCQMPVTHRRHRTTPAPLGFIRPEILVPELPSGEGWIHEIKYDG
jgi:hypothetical protein